MSRTVFDEPARAAAKKETDAAMTRWLFRSIPFGPSCASRCARCERWPPTFKARNLVSPEGKKKLRAQVAATDRLGEALTAADQIAFAPRGRESPEFTIASEAAEGKRRNAMSDVPSTSNRSLETGCDE